MIKKLCFIIIIKYQLLGNGANRFYNRSPNSFFLSISSSFCSTTTTTTASTTYNPVFSSRTYRT